MVKYYAINIYQSQGLEIIGTIKAKDKQTAYENYSDCYDEYIIQSEKELKEFYLKLKIIFSEVV